MKIYFCIWTATLLLTIGFPCEAQNIASQPAQVEIPSPTPYAITVQDGNGAGR
jgi:hypothetical protein